MFEHFYYDQGKYHICYKKKAIFHCENRESDKKEHINRGFWATGDYIYHHEEISRVRIDSHSIESVEKTISTKVHKGMKVNCPYCGGKIIFKGWYVWVENVKNEKVVGGGIFSTGSKTIYTKYCKTLKNRKETINRLLKKYKG